MTRLSFLRVFIEYGLIAESMEQQLHVVTGAFGYTGRWIAHQLLEKGADVF